MNNDLTFRLMAILFPALWESPPDSFQSIKRLEAKIVKQLLALIDEQRQNERDRLKSSWYDEDQKC